ncbi:helix-turn-helix transcriptional regulator [Clostridium sp. D43t1_170807_H7]|uniref:helix-turn-helix domain-containing protein n=1 Tax=Clostridium sp. D43t1_170807_H7 TaxID=2787140 RepID=UPI0018980FD3|nr:helix-turn-helix transcriptional regulator [Clostridium sp. D43t1_170807_H7]
MSLGEKLRECRKMVNLTQEELAEKLCVSRQAITKWESDKGIPDIVNIKNIAKLFDVSIDYLLDDGEIISDFVLKESINISDYKNKGKYKSKYDSAVRDKYKNAIIIYPLIQTKKLNLLENIIDFIVQPGVLQLADYASNYAAYYLVELEQKQLLVKITKEFIESKELKNKFIEKKMIIGNNIFKKCNYTI